jgi:hypothetical protein
MDEVVIQAQALSGEAARAMVVIASKGNKKRHSPVIMPREETV